MVAAVLHLHEGARVAFDTVDQVQRGFLTAMMSLTTILLLARAMPKCRAALALPGVARQAWR